jgi:integrase
MDFYDHHGERQRITLPKGTTKAQAREELRAIEEMVARRTFTPTKKALLFSQVARDWLEYKKTRLRETTWECYEGHVRNHFHDLDNLKINQITTASVEKFIAVRQTQGMKIGTLRKILVTLGQIFTYAVRHRYLDHNPLRDAERPRGRGYEGEYPQESIAILTPEQVAALLEEVTKPKYRTLFMLAIFAGARQGELLGLKWGDVDWEKNQVHVQRTFNSGRFFATKTKGSNRRIDLGPATMSELKKWRLACPKNNLGLVFPNEAGQPMDNKNMLRRHFRPALKAAGLPRFRFHDLRHTYASFLLHQGENIKYIQTQLGHSTPTVTINIYAHLMTPTNQEAVRRLENTVFGPTGHNLVTMNKKGARSKTITP